MNKEDEDRQMRETRSLLQRAGQRTASLDTRREALRRLIGLTRMPSAELKVYAAQNFSHYFKDFPELEEDVIDSVYDICEDPDSQVRIEGYKAIVALSTEAMRWTRRNTDVLVQLLQSDEPQELAEIKSSLIAHVNLDAAAAVGVMCDHCCLDPDLKNEEREDRERLRKIVLRFFATDAKKYIFPHFTGPGSEPERVFREGLIKAIEKADLQDTEVIVKELLLPLRSYTTPPSQYGEQLLSALLEKVKLIFTELKSKPGSVSLSPVKPYLGLMDCLVAERRAADPAPLLRFYGTALIGKIALQKLDQESQFTVIEKLATALRASEDERLKRPQGVSPDELTTLRNMVVDACPHLFDSMSKSPPDHAIPWKACVILLKACCQRHQDQRWDPPLNFIRSVQDLTRAEQIPGKSQDVSNDIQKLLNDLHIEPSKPIPPSKPERSGPPGAIKRKFDGGLPSSVGPGLRMGSVSTQPHDDRPPSGKEPQPQTSSTSQGFTAPESSRGSKLINRLGGDVTTGERSWMSETPTLLRRMSSSDAKPTNGAQTNFQQSPPPSSTDAGLSAPVPQAPQVMLSIKGAASKLLEKETSPQSPTLIDRMQVDSEFSHDLQASRKKKKRAKTGS